MRFADWFGEIWAPEQPATFDMVKKPRLVAVRAAPSTDAFTNWREDPVTLFVFAALRNAAAEQKAAWDEMSWHGGEANATLLTELRTRADAYESLEESSYIDFCRWAGVEPEGNDAD